MNIQKWGCEALKFGDAVSGISGIGVGGELIHLGKLVDRGLEFLYVMRPILNCTLYLMALFHWSRPCIRSYDSRIGCESCRIIEKKCENVESVKKSQTVHLQTEYGDYPDKT